MCDLIKLSTTVTIAPVDERLYGAPILCGARRDLALESDYGILWSTQYILTTTREGTELYTCTSPSRSLYAYQSFTKTRLYWDGDGKALD